MLPRQDHLAGLLGGVGALPYLYGMDKDIVTVWLFWNVSALLVLGTLYALGVDNYLLAVTLSLVVIYFGTPKHRRWF